MRSHSKKDQLDDERFEKEVSFVFLGLLSNSRNMHEDTVQKSSVHKVTVKRVVFLKSSILSILEPVRDGFYTDFKLPLQ